MIAYITTQGAKITREGRRLIVVAPDYTRTLFADSLEQILLFGNVHLTAPARFLLLQCGIDTVFLRADGRYMGRLSQAESANVFLRKKQFILSDDKDFCCRTAATIVQAKIANQATLLARVKRSRQQRLAGSIAKELRVYALAAQHATSVESLRGIEGKAAALYFRHLSLAFVQDWGFTRRVRRPPTDPVNAVLSLLYTVLINRCYAAIRIAGLDPYPACLHSLAYGRYALPLDMVEEFRALLADSLTISLFNMRVLDWGDFENPVAVPEHTETASCDTTVRVDNAVQDALGSMTGVAADNPLTDLQGEQFEDATVMHSNQPLLLRKPALKSVLTAFSKKLDTEFYHPVAARRMSYADALVFQARQYRMLVTGEIAQYTPLTLR